MNKKAKKLAIKFDTSAKQMTEGYLKLELPRVQRRAQIDALLIMWQSGKLKGTVIGNMLDRDELPWEGDGPQKLMAHVFELEDPEVQAVAEACKPLFHTCTTPTPAGEVVE